MVNKGVRQKLLGADPARSHGGRVCNVAVAYLEGLFGGFNQGMQVGVTFGLPDVVALAQFVKNGQYHQRGQALRGRCHVVQRGTARRGASPQAYFDLQRGNTRCPVRLQVSHAQWAAQTFVLGSDRGRDAATVVIIQAILGQRLQRIAQRGVFAQGIYLGDARAVQKLRGKPGLMAQFGQKLGGEVDLALRHRCTLLGVPDGILQQAGHWQFAAHASRMRQGLLPARDRTCCCQRRQRAPAGYCRQPFVFVKINRRQARGAATGVNADGFFPGLGDDPEAVTSDRVHMWVDHRNGGSGSHHGFDGIATFTQDGAGTVGSEVVRRGHHAAWGCEGLTHEIRLSKIGWQWH